MKVQRQIEIIRTLNKDFYFAYRNERKVIIACINRSKKAKSWSILINGEKPVQIELSKAIKILRKYKKEKELKIYK